jgi:hypothetical protein
MTANLQRRRAAPAKVPDDATENYAAQLGAKQVERIARAVAPLMIAQLVAALTGAAQPRAYSNRRGGAPEGYSREAWAALSRVIGTRRGRYFYVSQAQLDAHEAGLQEAPASVAEPAAWHPNMASAALGIRRLGGGK